MVSRGRRLALDALTALLAVSGVSLVMIGGRPPQPPPHRTSGLLAQGPPGPPTRTTAPGPNATASGNPVRAVGAGTGSVPLGRSEPVRLDIPAIGVSTPLMAVGLNADGTVAVPPLRADAPAAWYRYLATPGEVGPAVILGHVDTAHDGPAVFYRLRELRPGDTVAVRRADGSTAVFTVSQVTEHSKSAFPTDAVYGPVAYPALRLVTCGGTFDRLRRRYQGNVIAYARLTQVR